MCSSNCWPLQLYGQLSESDLCRCMDSFRTPFNFLFKTVDLCRCMDSFWNREICDNGCVAQTADLCSCMDNFWSQTSNCRPLQVYGQFSDPLQILISNCRPQQVYGHLFCSFSNWRPLQFYGQILKHNTSFAIWILYCIWFFNLISNNLHVGILDLLVRDIIKLDFLFLSGTCPKQGGEGVSEVYLSRTFSQKKFQNQRGGLKVEHNDFQN